ncbi:MAG: hypothetical protein V1495_04685 [Pseudomonadota bacterium]
MRKTLSWLTVLAFLAVAPAFAQEGAGQAAEKPKCPCMLKHEAACNHKDCSCKKVCNCGKSCGCPCCKSKEDKNV